MKHINETEIWKDIKEYEGLYQISSFGRIKNCLKIRQIGNSNNKRSYPERIMKARKLPKKQYLYIILCKYGKAKSFTIHRLVAEHFIENPMNLPCVNHKDCNQQNNKSSNLEWVTYSYNSKHAFINGKQPTAFTPLQNPSCIKVKNLKTNEIFSSVKEASKFLNIKYSKLLKLLSENKINYLIKI